VSLGALALTGSAPARVQVVDLSVAGIEVTQAIQTPTNSILLVSRRSTAVRATIGVGGTTTPVSGVTGRLHVLVNGTEVTPSGGVPPINAPFTAPLSPQRQNQNDTLNFELIAPTAITATSAAQFRVDVTPVTGETNTANNSLTTSNLTVVDRVAPLLFFTSINYTPSGLGLPAAGFIQPTTGDAFVRGILPVDDSTSTLYRQGLFPTLPFSEDADGNGRLAALGTDGNDLLSLLESCRQLIVQNGLGPSDRVFLYGWLAGNPIDGNGAATVGGRVAFGNTEPGRGQRSYAHELTHNFGLNHNTRTLDQVGWDVGGRLPNNPVGNNTTGRVKPMTFFDIQNAGRLTNEAWVDTITYNFLLNSPVLTAFADFASPPGVLSHAPRLVASSSAKFQRRVAVIQGTFDPKGTTLRRLKPVFRYPWPSAPTTPIKRGSTFTARVVDTSGSALSVPFTPLIADDPSREFERFGTFEVMVPVNPSRGISSVQIFTPKQTRVAALKRSRPPTIKVVRPQPGAILRGRVRVAWTSSDPDTPKSKLLYQVAYSPDAGRNWVPVAVDVPGKQTSIVFPSGRIRGSVRKGMIRVFVGDGLNTAFADTGRLSKPVS
jgi:hypothetical protein